MHVGKRIDSGEDFAGLVQGGWWLDAIGGESGRLTPATLIGKFLDVTIFLLAAWKRNEESYFEV